MKQLLQNLRNGKTMVAEVPVPSPRTGMVLVRTAASLVSSGTERMLVEFAEKNLIEKAQSRPDLVAQMMDKARREGLLTTIEAAFNKLDQPMTLGYSSAGVITAVGPGVKGFAVGDRVTCAGGGFAVHAEYEVVPQNLMARVPDGVDLEQAAFATLGAIALHGFRLANVQMGERVAVIGLGLLGLLTVGLARAAGCEVFGVDLDPGRVELARKIGAHAELRAQAVEAAQVFSRGRGCDAVLICADATSDDPVELAGTIARERANVVAVGAVGMHLPRKKYYEKELAFLISRSYGPGRYDPEYEEGGHDYPIGYVRWTEGRNLEAFVDLLASGKLDIRPLISHRVPIEDAPRAYELITGKRDEPFLGVLLTYSQEGAPAQPGDPVHNLRAAAVSLRPGEIISLGVLGAGNYASAVFLPVVQRVGGVAPVSIASATGVSAQHAAQRFGFGLATSSEEKVIQDPSINTLVILTRHEDHTRQILAGFQAGKRVFCEKPLAVNAEQLAGLEEALSQEHVPLLMAGFNRRFAPLARRLKSFLNNRSEPLFAHYRVNAGFLPLTHWLHDAQKGGGRIIGEGCHFIDFLTFLTGQKPVSVHAEGLPDGGRYCEDNVQITLRYADGSLGTISYVANGDKAFAKERVEVFAGGRVAVLDDFRSLEMVQNGRRNVVRSLLNQDKGHRAGWEAFLKALREGGQPPIPYDEMLAVTRASFAAMESLHEGKVMPVG